MKDVNISTAAYFVAQGTMTVSGEAPMVRLAKNVAEATGFWFCAAFEGIGVVILLCAAVLLLAQTYKMVEGILNGKIQP